MVNLVLRDAVLVNLGFHTCSHCLSMLIPFSQAERTTNTHRANRLSLGELPSGETTRYTIKCVLIITVRTQ